MAQERPNRLVELVALVRKNAPILREQARDWISEVREEPRLLWEASAIRYLTYGIGAILSIWLVISVVETLTPPPPAGARPESTIADYHVVCSDPACGYHFVVQREFGYRGFPIQCAKCAKQAGVSARRCNSSTCLGRWVAPVEVHGASRCPDCGAAME